MLKPMTLYLQISLGSRSDLKIDSFQLSSKIRQYRKKSMNIVLDIFELQNPVRQLYSFRIQINSIYASSLSSLNSYSRRFRSKFALI